MNSCTASYWVSCSSVGGGWRRGSVSGATETSCSPRMWRATRLVTRILTPGQAAISSGSSAAASVRCSKLSSSRSARLLASSVRRTSHRLALTDSRTPSAAAIAAGTSAGSTMEASSTNQTPSAKSASRPGCRLHRQPALANAARAGQGHQAHVLPPQQLPQGGNLRVAAEERRQLRREVVRRRPVDLSGGKLSGSAGPRS